MPNEFLTPEIQKKYQREELFLILSEDCPFDKYNPSICVLHQMRKRSQKERTAWFEKLSEEAIRKLQTSRQLCWKKVIRE